MSVYLSRCLQMIEVYLVAATMRRLRFDWSTPSGRVKRDGGHREQGDVVFAPLCRVSTASVVQHTQRELRLHKGTSSSRHFMLRCGRVVSKLHRIQAASVGYCVSHERRAGRSEMWVKSRLLVGH